MPDWPARFAELAAAARDARLQAFYAAGTVAGETALKDVPMELDPPSVIAPLIVELARGNPEIEKNPIHLRDPKSGQDHVDITEIPTHREEGIPVGIQTTGRMIERLLILVATDDVGPVAEKQFRMPTATQSSIEVHAMSVLCMVPWR